MKKSENGGTFPDLEVSAKIQTNLFTKTFQMYEKNYIMGVLYALLSQKKAV
ncbi:MAG TPA: hypothetical protein VHO90_01685 [Bacteroidales bacterium]|nr:hypothetical protein [Bacteroidales bacterium]